MPFPPESIAEAEKIAQKYIARSPGLMGRAGLLYRQRFLEIAYGLDDAIKQGIGGHFLHQLKTTADCFSVLGALYLIGKYAKLQPEMYWATGMVDIKEGSDAAEHMLGEHSFPTVKIGKDIYVDDPNLTLFGKVLEKQDGKWIIEINDETYGKLKVIRQFNHIKQISEDEYVKMMLQHQSQEYAREVLECGQVVTSRGNRVILQYVPPNQMVATFQTDASKPIISEVPGNFKIYQLIGPLQKGKWDLEDAMVRSFFCKRRSWELDKYELVHLDLSYPRALALQYLSHLEQAAEFHGRRTSIQRMTVSDGLEYFLNKGFNYLGELTSENGVDPAAHRILVDQIESIIDGFQEVAEALPSLHLHARYVAQKIRNMSEGNPAGFLYSQSARDRFVDESMQVIEANIQGYVDQLVVTIRAEAGFVPNPEKQKKILLHDHQSKMDANKFKEVIGYRRKFRHSFENHIDFALFQQENPVDKVTASEQDVHDYLRYRAHMSMVDMIHLLPVLEARPYQSGLNKILA
ncbi:MAG: hypothetical protein ABIJ34_03305 [archaeon]